MFKKYHWTRDFHDSRDHYAQTSQHFTLVAPESIPSSVDLRKFCSPVADQGILGSCTGNALVGAMEFLENKLSEYEQNGQFVNLSRLFVYYNERDIEGDIGHDGGAQISTGIKVLANTGVCAEAFWPYSIDNFVVKPTVDSYNDAASRKIAAYARVTRDNGIIDIKRVLASGYPIVFGFVVYNSFQTDAVSDTGNADMPSASDEKIGGHAVLMVGYDDATNRVLVRNSWGDAWGQKGYFTLPYEYVVSHDLANDLWTISK